MTRPLRRPPHFPFCFPPPANRAAQGSTLLWELPVNNTNVTHARPSVVIPAGTRIGFTGWRDTAPDTHALAVRVNWAADPAGTPPGAPLLSSSDWEVARVSEAFTTTFAVDAAPASWERAINVSGAVSAESKRFAPPGALHVAAAEPEADPNAKYWVAFRSPPTPAGGACSSAVAAAADGGSSLSTGAAAGIGVVAVGVAGALIGGVVWALSVRRRRRARAEDESEDGWPAKAAAGEGGGRGGDGGGAGGRGLGMGARRPVLRPASR